MRIGSLDLNNVRGLSDKGFGFGKEVIGSLIGNNRLQEEGEAQQARGTETLKALRKQAEAEKHAAKAETLEQKQKAAERAKSA